MLTILIIVLLAVGLLVGLLLIGRAQQVQKFVNKSTGQQWEPRFLIVAYDAQPGHNKEVSRSIADMDEGKTRRAVSWGMISMVANLYGAQVDDLPPIIDKYGCDSWRSYDLKGVPQRQREIMYCFASKLIDDCREAGVRAIAHIFCEPDLQPFTAGQFSDFLEDLNGAAELSKAMNMILAHANITDMADRPTSMDKCILKPITPDEYMNAQMKALHYMLDGSSP